MMRRSLLAAGSNYRFRHACLISGGSAEAFPHTCQRRGRRGWVVAATGEIELMAAWQSVFKKHKLQVAQILLSPSDAENKKSSKNAIATIENLLTFGCVPIINENDTTSTDEIKFGDNDILAAKISKLVSADHLILLSNIDGLCSSLG